MHASQLTLGRPTAVDSTGEIFEKKIMAMGSFRNDFTPNHASSASSSIKRPDKANIVAATENRMAMIAGHESRFWVFAALTTGIAIS